MENWKIDREDKVLITRTEKRITGTAVHYNFEMMESRTGAFQEFGECREMTGGRWEGDQGHDGDVTLLMWANEVAAGNTGRHSPIHRWYVRCELIMGIFRYQHRHVTPSSPVIQILHHCTALLGSALHWHESSEHAPGGPAGWLGSI